MEPALLGLDDPVSAGDRNRTEGPQWSQPCSGWMTAELVHLAVLRDPAAMEPALLGLDDEPDRDIKVKRRLRAAMEPALLGLDDGPSSPPRR